MNETESVALAALLHGLDKFRQRTAQKAILSIPFADQESDENIKSIIGEAERIASRMSDESPVSEEQVPGQSTEYLEAVTHRITMPRGEKQHNTSTRGPRYYPLQPLNLFESSGAGSPDSRHSPNIFPVRAGEVESRSLPGGYDRLWELFLAEAAQLPQESLRSYLDSLLHLMRKYAWCVPSGESGAGISLYDHSRVIAAIAVCLWLSRQEARQEAQQEEMQAEPEFLLIEGSISGIQRFIYNPALNAQEPQDGIARRIRGRSFYLTLMVKTLADYLPEKLGLCGLNVLWVTGGHFLILAPNTGRTRDALAAARQKIQRWLWCEHRGALGASIVDLAIAREQLQNFGPTLRQLEGIRRRAKLQQFSMPLGFADEPPDEAWENPWALKMGEGICADTGRDLSAEDRKISDWAQPGRAQSGVDHRAPKVRSGQSLLFDAIGRALVGARTIQLRRSGDWPEMAATAAMLPRSADEAARLKGAVKEVLIEFPPLDRVWLLSDDAKPRRQAGLCLRIAGHNNKKIEFLSGDASSSAARGFELMATAVKTTKAQGVGHETLASFQELAGRARGAKYIGTLRMDVDDLGHILQNEEHSIAKIANLSQMFDWFFAGYLNTLIEGKDLYAAYAGGDDLFLLGAWDQVLDLAESVHQRFRDFCGNHPDLHISGAIVLCKGGYPVGRAADEAGEALDSIAKTPAQVFRDRERRRQRVEGDSDKDALAFLETKISWRKWREVRSLGDRMIDACQTGKLSRRFIYNLLELYRYHIDPGRDPSREFAGEDLIWLPRFKFSLVKNVRDAQLRAYLIRAIEQNKHYLTVLSGYVLLKTHGRLRNRKEDV